jgi:hypothetical protein
MRLQVLCIKENLVLPPRQSKLLINKYWTVIIQLLLSKNWTVTVRPLFRFLIISGVIELHFKRDWSHWKAKTRGYKFYVERRTQFCPQDSQNCSSTNIRLLLYNCYYLKNWTVTIRPLFRFLTISGVIELHFKRDWSRWKAKTRGYKFYVKSRIQFCPQDSRK